MFKCLIEGFEESLEKLDKKNSYQVAGLVEDFAEYDTFDEFIEETEELSTPEIQERHKFKGYLITPYESISLN